MKCHEEMEPVRRDKALGRVEVLVAREAAVLAGWAGSGLAPAAPVSARNADTSVRTNAESRVIRSIVPSAARR
ncbi:MAG: hypothetical protein Kow0099_08000 [Candidatus Abyssubacteria bacterium]